MGNLFHKSQPTLLHPVESITVHKDIDNNGTMSFQPSNNSTLDAYNVIQNRQGAVMNFKPAVHGGQAYVDTVQNSGTINFILLI